MRQDQYPSMQQREMIGRHLVALLKDPRLHAHIASVRDALGVQFSLQDGGWELRYTMSHTLETGRSLLQMLGQAWFYGIGGEWLAHRLVFEHWEDQNVNEFAKHLCSALFQRGGFTQAEKKKVRPWYVADYVHPPRGWRPPRRKTLSGGLWRSRVSAYFCHGGNGGQSGGLHPTRVWNVEELREELARTPEGLLWPNVGTFPVQRSPRRLFIEVEPWALGTDVLRAYELGVEPFQKQHHKVIRPLRGASETSDDRNIKRAKARREVRPKLSQPVTTASQPLEEKE